MGKFKAHVTNATYTKSKYDAKIIMNEIEKLDEIDEDEDDETTRKLKKKNTDRNKRLLIKRVEKRHRRLLYHEQTTVCIIHSGASFGDSIFEEGENNKRQASIYSEDATTELLILKKDIACKILEEYQEEMLEKRMITLQRCEALSEMSEQSLKILAKNCGNRSYSTGVLCCIFQHIYILYIIIYILYIYIYTLILH